MEGKLVFLIKFYEFNPRHELDNMSLTIGQQLLYSQKINFSIAKRAFLKLIDGKPNAVQWIICAYAVGNYHLFVCEEGSTKCEECQDPICKHEADQCAKCDITICNRCSWTGRLMIKDKGLAGKLGEITCCQFCRQEIENNTKKRKEQDSCYLFNDDTFDIFDDDDDFFWNMDDDDDDFFWNMDDDDDDDFFKNDDLFNLDFDFGDSSFL